MTANDPWATTEPEAPVEPASPVASPRPEPAAAPGEIVVTLKGGKGYEAPWVVIHAASVASAAEQLADPDLKALLTTAARAGGYFAGLGGSAPAPAAQNTATRPGAPAGQPAPQQGPAGGQACIHGSMEFRSKVSKSGKAYEGYFCQSGDRDDECKVRNFKWL